MCAKEEHEILTTIHHGNTTNERTPTRLSNPSQDDISLQEESKFAGWFWRSTADRQSKRLWIIWLFILIINVGIVGYFAPFFGGWNVLILFLIIQSLATFIILPKSRSSVHQLFRLLHRASNLDLQRIYPLADVDFYLSQNQDVLLISHKGGLSATALLVVDKLPVGIRGNMSAFIRAIYSAGVPLFYTLIHAPVSEQKLPQLGALSDNAQSTLSSYDPSQLASFAWRCGGVWKTRLLLGTRRDSSNLDDNISQEMLETQVQQDLQALQIAFRTAYPHIRLRRLTSQELEDGVRSTLLLGKPPHFF
jgi:hypothetical protein